MSVLPLLPGAELLACVPRLRRYARALVGERAAADDLVQDTLERGWAQRAALQPGTDARAWLFAIMHNMRIDQIRRGALVTEPLDDDTPMPALADRSTVGIQVREMDAALRLLSEEQRAILLMVGLEDMRYEEVASTLGIPVGTVMSRLARAREKLRSLMDALAGSYHRWYDNCRVIPQGDDPVTAVHNTRLWLNDAVAQVLRSGLGLLGVSAPERM